MQRAPSETATDKFQFMPSVQATRIIRGAPRNEPGTCMDFVIRAGDTRMKTVCLCPTVAATTAAKIIAGPKSDSEDSFDGPVHTHAADLSRILGTSSSFRAARNE